MVFIRGVKKVKLNLDRLIFTYWLTSRPMLKPLIK